MSLDVTFVYTFLVVVVAALFLRKALFEPVGKLLDERAARLKGDTEERARALRDREARILDYQGRLQAARRTAYEARESSRRMSMEARGEILAGARVQAEKATERGRGEVAEASGSARQMLASESGALARDIAARVLGRPVPSV